MENRTLKVVFLIHDDDASTRQSIEAVCKLPGIQPVGLLLDTEAIPFKRRVRNLTRNIQANGWRYPIVRVLRELSAITTRAICGTAVSASEVQRVLNHVFPESCFSLEDVAKKFATTLYSVGNLNGIRAIEVITQCKADLGIVLGTRILKPGTFTVPKIGCINLHKGKVPDYRGTPPGFWELYDGASSVGVTIHFIDRGLDTGEIVATSEIPILRTDTPDTLLEKLRDEGAKTLVMAVSLIRDGIAKRQAQRDLSVKPKTKPTRFEVEHLHRKLKHWKEERYLSRIVRNLYLLFIYYSGIYLLVRTWHRLWRSRAVFFLYHRVNDYSKDVLTVDSRTFVAQLLALSKRYHFGSTGDLVDCIRNRKPIEPTTIAIHFDDCYRDILLSGAPILEALGIPACAFVNSGFLDTDRGYPHDLDKYPFEFPKLQSSDLRSWAGHGFEVGAHTVNHVDLGTCTADVARTEVALCGQELSRILKRPITLFSFPFGQRSNIRPETRDIVRQSGYRALFSAYGGFVERRTDPFYIPRIGLSNECSPLYCLLAIEGLTLSQLGDRLKGLTTRIHESVKVTR